MNNIKLPKTWVGIVELVLGVALLAGGYLLLDSVPVELSTILGVLGGLLTAKSLGVGAKVLRKSFEPKDKKGGK